MDKKIIVFNGPPGSGKDMCVGMARVWLYDNGQIKNVHMKMATPLKEATHALFGGFLSKYSIEHDRELKEKTSGLLLGMSPREAYIKVSEECIKPVFGSQFFGTVCANVIHNRNEKVFLFSDGGFVDEWIPIVSIYGAENVTIVELHSPQCNFDNDSRSYIGDDLKKLYPALNITRITNNITGDPLDREVTCMLVHSVVAKVVGDGL